MKNAKPNQGKENNAAEEWINAAKEFGDKCLAIQRDSKLSNEQKLNKQKELCQTMLKQIEADSSLSSEDKKKMTNSINRYIQDWSKMYNILQSSTQTSGSQEKKPKK